MGKQDASNIGTPAIPAKPTAPAKKAKRIEYPGIGGDNYPFTTVPADYSADRHKPLKKRDFKNEWDYLRYQADLMQQKADALRKEAEEAEKMGDSKTRAAMKRLQQMTSKISELTAVLEAAGVDVNAIIAAAGK